MRIERRTGSRRKAKCIPKEKGRGRDGGEGEKPVERKQDLELLQTLQPWKSVQLRNKRNESSNRLQGEEVMDLTSKHALAFDWMKMESRKANHNLGEKC